MLTPALLHSKVPSNNVTNTLLQKKTSSKTFKMDDLMETELGPSIFISISNVTGGWDM